MEDHKHKKSPTMFNGETIQKKFEEWCNTHGITQGLLVFHADDCSIGSLDHNIGAIETMGFVEYLRRTVDRDMRRFTTGPGSPIFEAVVPMNAKELIQKLESILERAEPPPKKEDVH